MMPKINASTTWRFNKIIEMSGINHADGDVPVTAAVDRKESRRFVKQKNQSKDEMGE